ncbi:MAG: hypothetical protein ACK5RO_04060 [Pseudobdellovibrionaceae bacterium]
MKKQLSILTAGALVLASFSQAQAMSVEWTGNYRFEYTQLSSTTLGSPQKGKSYFLNSLQLSPKIIAADGMNVVAKFDVLTNSAYPDSQAGAVLGGGPTKGGTGGSSTADDAAVSSGHQGSTELRVSQLYRNVNPEYGAIVVGRAPIEFGLGITHNAGNGMFDHWSDTMDMVGYKFLIGNLSLMPIIGKPYNPSPNAGGEVTDVIWNIEYNNPETESIFGIFHQSRSAGLASNDANPLTYGAGATKIGGWKTQSVNFLLGRGWDSFKFKLEAGFNSGDTGIQVSGQEVKLNGYGIVTEMNFPRPESKSQWSLKAGLVSGDDPDTTNFEGYALDRNYDIAFLLFNHSMGQYDVFRSQFQRPSRQCGTAPCSPYDRNEAIDDDAVSNVVFVSPTWDYKMSDRWSWRNSLTWAQLQADPIAGGTVKGKDVGFEWDTAFVYNPHERLTWVNQFGFLFQGSAWAGTEAQNFDKKFNYGFVSKAAISF